MLWGEALNVVEPQTIYGVITTIVIIVGGVIGKVYRDRNQTRIQEEKQRKDAAEQRAQEAQQREAESSRRLDELKLIVDARERQTNHLFAEWKEITKSLRHEIDHLKGVIARDSVKLMEAEVAHRLQDAAMVDLQEEVQRKNARVAELEAQLASLNGDNT
jgi:DNA repair exonuclease SbcCD ATPase subunit